VRFETAPLAEPVTVMGQGHVVVWLRPDTVDTSVQVTLTEVRPDGVEIRVQSGWHRPVHRQEDPTRSDDARVDYTFHADHRQPLVPGEWTSFRLPLMPVAHVFRPGTRMRLTVSTPGRDCPFWCFDNPVQAGAGHDVGFGPSHPSELVLPVWNDMVAPPELPPADSLRGQPHRHAADIANVVSEV
jgi:predicted acyl esterase